MASGGSGSGFGTSDDLAECDDFGSGSTLEQSHSVKLFQSIVTCVTCFNFDNDSPIYKNMHKIKHRLFNSVLIKYRHMTYLVSTADTVDVSKYCTHKCVFLDSTITHIDNETLFSESVKQYEIQVYRWLPHLNLVLFTITDAIKTELNNHNYTVLKLENIYTEPLTEFETTVTTCINNVPHELILTKQSFPLLRNKTLGRSINYESSCKVSGIDGDNFHIIVYKNKVLGMLDFVTESNYNYVPMFVIHQVLKNKVNDFYSLPFTVTLRTGHLQVANVLQECEFKVGDLITHINDFTLTCEIMNDKLLCLPCDVYLKLVDSTKPVKICITRDGINHTINATLFGSSQFLKIPSFLNDLTFQNVQLKNVELLIGNISYNYMKLFDNTNVDLSELKKIKNIKESHMDHLNVVYGMKVIDDVGVEIESLSNIVNNRGILLPIVEIHKMDANITSVVVMYDGTTYAISV